MQKTKCYTIQNIEKYSYVADIFEFDNSRLKKEIFHRVSIEIKNQNILMKKHMIANDQDIQRIKCDLENI